MTTVKCPICKDKVFGATTADLNNNFREHLADVHQMRELTMSRYETTERPMERQYVREERMEPEERRRYEGRDYPYYERRPAVSYFSVPESRTEREVETWSTRSPERFRSENYIPREEVRQWRYPVTGPAGERGPIDRSTSSERLRAGLTEREEERGARKTYEESRTGVIGPESAMPATVNCPLCGNLVRGRDEDDLSDELRDHMSDAHDIRPRMAARFRT